MAKVATGQVQKSLAPYPLSYNPFPSGTVRFFAQFSLAFDQQD